MRFLKRQRVSCAQITPRVKNVLAVLPTNIGDVMMCMPSVDYIRSVFPTAKYYAVVSPGTRDFILHLSSFDAVLEYKKDWDWSKKLHFSLGLSGRYQAVFDYKNSALPLFARPLLRLSFFRVIPEHVVRMVDAYLSFTQKALRKCTPPQHVKKTYAVLEPERRAYWERFFQTDVREKAIFIAYASNAHKKNYPLEHFMEVCRQLSSDRPIVLLGRKEQAALGRQLVASVPDPQRVWDLTGKTTLWEVFHVISKYAAVVIGNDSGIMHMSSYVNTPTVGIFGPTIVERFGPWSDQARAVVPQTRCPVCNEKHCTQTPAHCLTLITPQQVIDAVRSLLNE